MIIKRVRSGHRQDRDTVELTAISVFALTRYVVDADPASVTLPGQLRGVTEYLVDAMAIWSEPGEKVAAFGAFNSDGKDLPDWQIDMAAVAMMAPRSRDPLEHYVFSWPVNESPTAKQVEEAARIFLQVLGFAQCPAVWAWHTNTANHHGHLAVVRIDKETGKVAGSTWDIDLAHQALALVEDAQGWTPEKNALFYARDGAVFRVKTDEMVRDADGNKPQRHHRERAELPNAIEAVAAKLRQAGREAANWPDFHTRFRAVGARYDAKGSGAVICVNDDVVKASQVDPSLSLKMLEKRLAKPFSPDETRIDREFEAYLVACRAEIDRLRAERKVAVERLARSVEAVLNAAAELADANALKRQRAIRAEHKVAMKTLNEAFDAAMHKLASQRLSALAWHTADKPAPPSVAAPTFICPAPQNWGTSPDADTDLGGEITRSSPALVSSPWRDDPPESVRNSPFSRPNAQQADGIAPNAEWQSDDFDRRMDGLRTTYVDVDGRPAFVDCGSVVIILNPTHDRTVEAALQLAAARWTVIKVEGSAEFIALSVKIAERHGVVLTDRAGVVLTLNPQSNDVGEQAPEPPSTTGTSQSWLLPARPPNIPQSRQYSPEATKMMIACAQLYAKLVAEDDAQWMGPPKTLAELMRWPPSEWLVIKPIAAAPVQRAVPLPTLRRSDLEVPTPQVAPSNVAHVPKASAADSGKVAVPLQPQRPVFGFEIAMSSAAAALRVTVDTALKNGTLKVLVHRSGRTLLSSDIEVLEVCSRLMPEPGGQTLLNRLVMATDFVVSAVPADFYIFPLKDRDQYRERLQGIAKDVLGLPAAQPFANDIKAVCQGLGRIKPHLQLIRGETAIALVHPPLKASLERVLAAPALAAFVDALFALESDPLRFRISQDVEHVILRGQNAVSSARGLPPEPTQKVDVAPVSHDAPQIFHRPPDRSRGR